MLNILGIVKPSQILASGPNLMNLLRWKEMGAETTNDNGEVKLIEIQILNFYLIFKLWFQTVTKSDIIFICVKPNVLETCARQIEGTHTKSSRDKDKIFVSVLAGINLEILMNVS